MERLGITQEFGFEDHAGIYRYADNNSPINEAPIKIVDASVDPSALTFYPEYPISEFSSPPAFDINVVVVNVALNSTQGVASDGPQSLSGFLATSQGQENFAFEPIESGIIR